jgi:iron complex outermembrane receptor protein
MNYGGLAENLKAMNGAGMVFADSTISELGTYAFVQQTLAEKLVVNAGLRLQHHNIFGQKWIPSVGFSYKLGQETTWKGTISKGYRSPTLRELFMWGTKNPDLKPESIVNYETGFLKTFMDNRINAELTIFKVTGDNLIVTVPVNGASQYQNTGEISNTGIEFSCNAQATKNLLFNATYSFIHMENPVYATPEHHIYLNALFHSGKWQISGTVQQIINLDNDASSVVNKVNYTLVQAKTMYRLNKNLKVYVSAENILNRTYAVNRYYTMPGTTFFAGINLNL